MGAAARPAPWSWTMKLLPLGWIVPLAPAAAVLAACLAPGGDAVTTPYREPRGGAASYEGMLNERQHRHLRTATFPRLSAGERQLLRRVNADVNRDIHYLSDAQNYAVPDRAVTEPPLRSPLLAQLPPARYGDCEDYALTKKHRLARAGFSPSRTFVTLANVPEDDRRVMHTVLAVPEGSEWWILNNWNNDIRRASTLENWWDWEFIRPRYDTYLLASQMRRISGREPASSGSGRSTRGGE